MQGLHSFGAAAAPQAAPPVAWPRCAALRLVPRRPQPLAAAFRRGRGGCALAAAAAVPARPLHPAGGASRTPRLRCRLRPASPPCARLLAAPRGRTPPLRLPRCCAAAGDSAEAYDGGADGEAWGGEERGDSGLGPDDAEDALQEAELSSAERQRLLEERALEAEFVAFQQLDEQVTAEDIVEDLKRRDAEDEEVLKQLEEYAAKSDPAQMFAEAMMSAFPLPLLELAQRYNAEEGEREDDEETRRWKARAAAANDKFIASLQLYKDHIDNRHARETKTVQQYFEELDQDADLLDDEFFKIETRMKLLRLMEAGKGDKLLRPRIPRSAKVLMDAVDSGDPSMLLKVLLGQKVPGYKKPKRKATPREEEEDMSDMFDFPDFDELEERPRERTAEEPAEAAARERMEDEDDQAEGDDEAGDAEEEEEEDEVEYESESDSDEEDEEGEEEDEWEDGEVGQPEAEGDDEEAAAAAQEAEMQRVLTAADAAARADASADPEFDEEEEEEEEEEEDEDEDEWEDVEEEEEEEEEAGEELEAQAEAEAGAESEAAESGEEPQAVPQKKRRKRRTWSPMYGRELFWVLERSRWSGFKILGMKESEVPGFPEPVLIRGVTETLEPDCNKEIFFCYEKNPRTALAVAAIALQVFECSAVVLQDFEDSHNIWKSLNQPGPILLVKNVREAALDFMKTFYEEPSSSLTCLGICGNIGTTAKAHLIQAVMQSTGQISGLMTPLGYEVGSTPVPPTLPPEFKEDVRTTKRKPGMRRNKALIIPKWPKPKRLSRRGDIFIPRLAGAIMKEEKRWTTTPYFLSVYKGKYTRPGIKPLSPIEMTRVLAGFVAQGAESATIELTPVNCTLGMADHTRFDVLVYTGLAKPSYRDRQQQFVVRKQALMRDLPPEVVAKRKAHAAAILEAAENMRKEARAVAAEEGASDPDKYFPESEYQAAKAAAAAVLDELEKEQAYRASVRAGEVVIEQPEEDPLLRQYRDAVASVFRTQNDSEQQRAVINVDDPEAQYIRDSTFGGSQVVTYSSELRLYFEPDPEIFDKHNMMNALIEKLPKAERAAWDTLQDELMQAAQIAIQRRLASTAFDAGAANSQFPPDYLIPRLPDWFLELQLTPEQFQGNPQSSHHADVYPISIEVCIWDTKVLFYTPLGEVEIRSCLLGREVVSDLAAAVAVGLATGVPLESIKEALENFRGVPGSMQAVDEGQPFAVVVDKARTPAQIRKAITTMRDLGAQNVITVVGAKWFTTKKERYEIGRTVHNFSDTVIITNDDPNTENEFKILNDVAAGFVQDIFNSREMQFREPPMPNFNFMRDWADIALDANHERETDPWLAMQWQSYAKRYVIAERFHAIRAALGFANDGDAVLLLGKGAQDYHIVGEAKWWFDDWCEATDALRVLGSPSMANLKLDLKQLPYRMIGGKRRERKGVGGLTEAVRGTSGKAECVPAYLTEDYEAYPEENNFIDRLMEQDDEIYGVKRWEDAAEMADVYKPVITEEMLRAYAREKAGLPPEEPGAAAAAAAAAAANAAAAAAAEGSESDSGDDAVAAGDSDASDVDADEDEDVDEDEDEDEGEDVVDEEEDVDDDAEEEDEEEEEAKPRRGPRGRGR